MLLVVARRGLQRGSSLQAVLDRIAIVATRLVKGSQLQVMCLGREQGHRKGVLTTGQPHASFWGRAYFIDL